MAKYAQKNKEEKYTPRQKTVRRRVLIFKIIFYVFLVAYIGVFLYFARYGFGLLQDWLVRLEESQPNKRSQEVFDELFAEPDWKELYHMAGQEDTLYEGAQAYATYMENLVGDKELTFVETSAGLSGNKKYIVKLDSTKVAEFTLTNAAPEDEEIPDWTLDSVSVFYTRRESLTIFTVPGHTVFINGVAISPEEHAISTTYTVAEDYLPEGVHGYRDMVLSFDGLLIQPEVTIVDENGLSMEVTYDPAIKLYAEVLPEREPISEEQRNTVIEAGKAYGKYMITALKKADLKKHFFADGPAFSDITSVERFMQDYKSYEFDEPEISEYYRYSDELYSAHIRIVLSVTRKNGTVKDYTLESTFFLQPDDQGNWLVYSMTNVHLQEQITLVKLEYRNGNQTLHTQWVNAHANQIALPEVEVPDGKVFAGWYTKKVDGLDIIYSLVFAGTEDGIVNLPENYQLSPMVLYAQFTKEDTQ